MYGLFYPAFPQQTLHFLPLQLHYLQGLCLIQILGCGREYIPGQVALGIAGAVAGIRGDFEEEFQTPWRYWRTIITLCSGVTATTTAKSGR